MIQNNKIMQALLFLFLAAFVSAADRGSHTVSSLNSRKQAILNNGGGIWGISIAMLEIDNLNTNYAYGDGKTGDSANFNIFKQNWFMLRTTTTQFKSYIASDFNKGAVLNSNLAQS